MFDCILVLFLGGILVVFLVGFWLYFGWILVVFLVGFWWYVWLYFGGISGCIFDCILVAVLVVFWWYFWLYFGGIFGSILLYFRASGMLPIDSSRRELQSPIGKIEIGDFSVF